MAAHPGGPPWVSAVAGSMAAAAGPAAASGAWPKLGFKYCNGDQVGRDDEQALFWYRKVGHDGPDSAQYKLGMVYRRGVGVGRGMENP